MATTGSIPPPPPPPPPGSAGAIHIPTYQELQQQQQKEKQAQQQIQSITEQQFANLPPQLMSTLSKDKKPFTYTPLAVGDRGKLDLSQIRSPRMKKRLIANLKENDENVESETENRSLTPDILANSQYDFDLTPSLDSLKNYSHFNSYSSPKPAKVFTLPHPSKLDFAKEIQEVSRLSPQHQGFTSKSMSPNDFEDMVNKQIEGLDFALRNQTYSPPRQLSSVVNNNHTNSNLNYNYNSPSFNTTPQPYTSSTSYNSMAQKYPSPEQVARNYQPIQANHSYKPNVSQGFKLTCPEKINLLDDQKSKQSYKEPEVMGNYAPTLEEQWLARKDHSEPSSKYHEPTQSRSFKILQKLTEGIEDEIKYLKKIQDQILEESARQPSEQQQNSWKWRPHSAQNTPLSAYESAFDPRYKAISEDEALISSSYEPYHSLNSNRDKRPVSPCEEANRGYLTQQGRHVSFPSPAVPARLYRASQTITTSESYLNPRSLTPVGTDF